jgi:hypothetical protein
MREPGHGKNGDGIGIEGANLQLLVQNAHLVLVRLLQSNTQSGSAGESGATETRSRERKDRKRALDVKPAGDHRIEASPNHPRARHNGIRTGTQRDQKQTTTKRGNAENS